MATNSNQQGWARSGIRVPRDLHEQTHKVAQQEGRSFNAQLLTFIREGVQARATRQEVKHADAAA